MWRGSYSSPHTFLKERAVHKYHYAPLPLSACEVLPDSQASLLGARAIQSFSVRAMGALTKPGTPWKSSSSGHFPHLFSHWGLCLLLLFSLFLLLELFHVGILRSPTRQRQGERGSSQEQNLHPGPGPLQPLRRG